MTKMWWDVEEVADIEEAGLASARGGEQMLQAIEAVPEEAPLPPSVGQLAGRTVRFRAPLPDQAVPEEGQTQPAQRAPGR